MARMIFSSVMRDLGAGGVGESATSSEAAGGSTEGSAVEVEVDADSALTTTSLRVWETLETGRV